MNTQDILHYGNTFLMDTLERVPQSHWASPNVCGIWSVKDIMAHLASYELMLIDVLQGLIDPDQPMPIMAMIAEIGPANFNDHSVAQRKDHSPQAVLDEYLAGFEKAKAMAAQIPLAEQTRIGALPWYGPEYDLQDFIVYSFYGHKREHGAQVAVFADTLG